MTHMLASRVIRRRPPAGLAAAFLLAGVVLGAGCSSPAAVGKVAAAGLPFIEDDYGAALAQARERHLPLFIEAWAPW